MSDNNSDHQGEGGRQAVPPRAPNPSHGGGRPQDTNHDDSERQKLDEPLELQSSDWDIMSISAMGAMMTLVQVVQSLSNITGEIPPTPPITRPTTPKQPSRPNFEDVPSTPVVMPPSPTSPVSPQSVSTTCFPSIPIGSPEVHRDEAMPTMEDVGTRVHEEGLAIQHAAISRRFFLKSTPPFSLADYLMRLHRYCPHSPAVYLTAAAWIHRLCVVETLVPATPRTVHRLCLATIRVASKTLEDNKWTQERIAKVGGIALHELTRIEVSLCFLLDFNLFVRAEELQDRMWQLQQTTRQGLAIRKRLSDGFNMRMPSRSRPDHTKAIPVG